MAFVRTKLVKDTGKEYRQLVRSYREGGKSRQEVLYHLGRHRSLEAAIGAETDKLKELWNERADWLHTSEHYQVMLEREGYLELFFDGQMPSLAAAQERQADIQKTFREFFKNPPREQHYEYLEDLRLERIALEEVFEYYGAEKRVSEYEILVMEQTKKLDKLLDLQRKYFPEQLSGSEKRRTARDLMRFSSSEN